MRAPSRGLAPPDAPKAGVQQLGRHGAGVQGVHRDAAAAQPLGELVGEEQVAELGERRRPVAVVACSPCRSFEVDRRPLVHGRAHHDDARRRARRARRSSSRLVSRNGRQVVDLERGLETVFGEVAALLVDAGVVDQDVEAVGEAVHLVGQRPDLAQRLEVGRARPRPLVAGRRADVARAPLRRGRRRGRAAARARPRRASSRAVSLPMPSVAPVTMTVRPRTVQAFAHTSAFRAGVAVVRGGALRASGAMHHGERPANGAAGGALRRRPRAPDDAQRALGDLVPRGPSTHPLPAL